MNEVTRILSAIEEGDPHAAEQLLPLVYDELRQLAAHRLAQEKRGQTLQATALVQEAYLRLVGGATLQRWDSRRHFFAAACAASTAASTSVSFDFGKRPITSLMSAGFTLSNHSPDEDCTHSPPIKL